MWKIKNQFKFVKWYFVGEEQSLRWFFPTVDVGRFLVGTSNGPAFAMKKCMEACFFPAWVGKISDVCQFQYFLLLCTFSWCACKNISRWGKGINREKKVLKNKDIVPWKLKNTSIFYSRFSCSFDWKYENQTQSSKRFLKVSEWQLRNCNGYKLQWNLLGL